MKFRVLILFCFLITPYLCLKAQTQTLNSLDEARDLSVKVVTLIYKDSSALVMQTLGPYSTLTSDEQTYFTEDLPEDFHKINQAMGKPEGFMKIDEINVGNVRMQEVYFILYSETAIRVRFDYYKGLEKWRLIDFRIDENFVAEFKEEK